MKTKLLIAALFCITLQAQKFDVVSVKTCKPGDMVPGGSSPGRLHIGCWFLANTDNTGLIQLAYNRYASGQLTSYGVIPIEGGPDWIRSDTFQIDAKSDGQPSIQMMEGPMMQAILEDRGKLRIRRETRQGPVYELTVGKGSPKLKPFQEGSCIPAVLGRSLPPLTADQHYCRNMVSPRGVDFQGGTLSMLAGLLNLILDRPVIDKTGITTYFEMHLTFSPDDSQDVPRIFEAIQEQLGLKLVPAKGPVDVLVIDHIERPTQN